MKFTTGNSKQTNKESVCIEARISNGKIFFMKVHVMPGMPAKF